MRDPLQILIREKAKHFHAAEKEYWREKDTIRKNMQEAASALSLKVEQALPSDVASIVWGLKDGVAFVRYKTFAGRHGVEFRILPIDLDKWADTGLVVPIEAGEISLAQMGIKGLGHLVLINCQINEIHIPYAEIAHLRYGEDISAPSVERAILDLQLTLMGIQSSPDYAKSGQISASKTIEELEKIANEFEQLIEEGTKEEEVQKFLKEHSFILHQSAERLSKQKLGEDFVTDFVLVATTTQGPTYILVELERSSHKILTKDQTLAYPVNKAIKQTREWDVWLEKNKAYIQNKLPGFETPSYMVVIGRSKDFDDEQKAYMRSYNREWRNIELLTYDDILARFRATIEKLKKTVSS